MAAGGATQPFRPEVGKHMISTRDNVVEPAVLQSLISETMWEIKKAKIDHDLLAVRRAKSHLSKLLDEFAGSMISNAQPVHRVGLDYSISPRRPARLEILAG
jgi:hypothetical protein